LLPEQQTQRQHVRFKPESNEYAQIDTTEDLQKQFEFQYVGLIVDEAPYGGCCLLTYDSLIMLKGDIVRVKLGPLSPLKAEVVWVKSDSNNTTMYGVKFLE